MEVSFEGGPYMRKYGRYEFEVAVFILYLVPLPPYLGLFGPTFMHAKETRSGTKTRNFLVL